MKRRTRLALLALVVAVGALGLTWAWRGAATDPIRVGVLHSLTGTMAISERSVVDATLVAIQDVNRSGGLLGRPVEAVVREECEVPWRVYRPAVVVGHSETGAMDKVDGPYYFFPLFKRMRDSLPQWLPLLGLDLGDTNVVPVDYVAKAMDHIAHEPGLDGQAFHLVNPDPQPTVEVVNTFATAAQAPRFAVPFDRRVTGILPRGVLPRALRPSGLVSNALRLAPVQLALRETIGRLGVPPEVLEHVSFPGPASPAPTWTATPSPCGTTGRTTSTARPRRTTTCVRRWPAGRW